MKKDIAGTFKVMYFEGRKILYGITSYRTKSYKKELKEFKEFGSRRNVHFRFEVLEEYVNFFGRVKTRKLSPKDPAYKEVMELQRPKEKLSDRKTKFGSDYEVELLSNMLAQRICLNTVIMNMNTVIG